MARFKWLYHLPEMSWIMCVSLMLLFAALGATEKSMHHTHPRCVVHTRRVVRYYVNVQHGWVVAQIEAIK